MLKRWLTRSRKRAGVPLYLNVYDLSSVNGYLYWLGLGIYHSAVEAHGVEYAFGAHDFSSSGIFEVEPRSCPGFQFRRRIKLGTIQLDSKDFRVFMERIASEYNGNTYHLMVKNCNHFCNDVSLRLTGSAIPGWVNRLAKLGTLCTCFLPDDLRVTAVEVMFNGDNRHKSTQGSLAHSVDYCTKKSVRKCQTRGGSPSSQPMKQRHLSLKWKQLNLSNLKFRKLEQVDVSKNHEM
ncbi:hypothetical protein KP509_05G032700 [Ceratopteris richardii]|uniref:PPPDE domain-containing protein n=1 Tax=Ceratopteris richardii TaxID=49495 RepID=A0A8T2USG3_CERRI|nr:hypothetical protein KP509_05G032700 [Ceratopteris richardii]